MASTSASGIACAGLIAALAVSTSSPAANPALQPTAAGDVRVEIAGLRDSHGVVRLCLTARADDFPDCKKGGALSGVVKAGGGTLVHTFRGVAPGTYAIAAFHDANGNNRLDTSLGIPREGFAFSRNPPMRPRAPRFNETSFVAGPGTVQRLKMRYLL